ncbi:hypothetical protein VTN00DRAFT_1663 [Thermoascus crustaceus]|uniref:uncharacterized protein n=1 Tax=Thermoascus crustaceus TaxID=5088 RepID=UPI003742BBCC
MTGSWNMARRLQVGPAITRVTVPYPPYAYRIPAAAASQWQRVHVIVYGGATNGKLSLAAPRALTSPGCILRCTTVQGVCTVQYIRDNDVWAHRHAEQRTELSGWQQQAAAAAPPCISTAISLVSTVLRATTPYGEDDAGMGPPNGP